jgi:hypothetical protein
MTMLNTLVSIIDRALRARQRIFEYSDRPNCVFRIELTTLPCDIALSDGTRLSAGSRFISLHLWNEHLPPFPARGPTLGWARRMCREFEMSLEELAAFIDNNAALEDVIAVGGKMMFGSTDQIELVAHFAGRFGFVRSIDPAPDHSIAERLHAIGENILISMIVIARNPGAFRADLFHRDRVPVYLRREELMRRFGSDVRKHQPEGEWKRRSFGSIADARK